MGRLYLLAIPLLLSGCAMPAAFTVASLALDTGSFMVSGKTLTDHGLSLAMEEDCSMVRLLDEGDQVCRSDPDYEVADALTPLPHDRSLDIALAAGPEPYKTVRYAQLADRVHQARIAETPYLAAGMIDSDI